MTRKATPTGSPIFQEDAAAFRHIAQAISAEDPATALPTRRAILAAAGATIAATLPSIAAAESAQLSEGDREALQLWDALRAAKEAYAEASDRHNAALATIPPHLRGGQKYVGMSLTEESETEFSRWPAIVDVEPPTFGRRNIRPGPLDLSSRYETSLTLCLNPLEDASARSDRLLDRFVAEVAALGERVKAQRSAEKASGLDELSRQSDAACRQLTDAENAVLEIPCMGPHATACVAMLRWESEARGDSSYPEPNVSFFRNVLTSLLPRLTGTIAVDVAEALAREDDEAPDQTLD